MGTFSSRNGGQMGTKWGPKIVYSINRPKHANSLKLRYSRQSVIIQCTVFVPFLMNKLNIHRKFLQLVFVITSGNVYFSIVHTLIIGQSQCVLRTLDQIFRRMLHSDYAINLGSGSIKQRQSAYKCCAGSRQQNSSTITDWQNSNKESNAAASCNECTHLQYLRRWQQTAESKTVQIVIIVLMKTWQISFDTNFLNSLLPSS